MPLYHVKPRKIKSYELVVPGQPPIVVVPAEDQVFTYRIVDHKGAEGEYYRHEIEVFKVTKFEANRRLRTGYVEQVINAHASHIGSILFEEEEVG